MKAMILAAGLGTRLRPLTDTRPKALVEVQGRPMLAWVLARLVRHGFTDIVVNAYHLADQIEAFADAYQDRYGHTGVRITVSRETCLLGTGGGVQQAAWFFDDGQPFLVHNADVLTDLDLSRLMDAHRNSDALATLAVHHRDATRCLLFDGRGLCGWRFLQTDETRMARPVDGPVTPLPFMCAQVISPAIFDLLTLSSPFSLIDAYLELAAAGEPIMAFHGDGALWMDLGRREHLDRAPDFFGAAFFETLNVKEM